MDHRQNSRSSRSPSPSSGAIRRVPLPSETSPLLDSRQGRRCSNGSDSYSKGSLYSTTETEVCTSRFWILFWFTVIGLNQAVQWNSWGPISESVLFAYPEWKPSTIAMMANWGTITVLVFIIPSCWVTQRYGLRTGTLACAGLITFGTALRCLPVSDHVFTILCHVCAICVGTAGTLLAAPGMLAATWFPPEERTTATAVSQVASHVGSLVAYLQPLLVRPPGGNITATEGNIIAPGGNVTRADIRGDIARLLQIDAIAAAVIFLIVIIYFPNKPSIPPSITSHQERQEFVPSIKKLLKNKSVWLVAIAFGVSAGIPSVWMGVMNFSLLSMGIHESEAMCVGIAAVSASVVSPVVVARITDRFYGFVRGSAMLLLVGATASFYWFYLLSTQTIPVYKWEVYVSTSLGLMCVYGTNPLFFELAVESAYPCPEVVVGGLLSAVSNVVGLIFLFIFLAPIKSFEWVTYVLLCSNSLTLIPLLLLKESYGRSSIDRDELEEQSSPASESQVPRLVLL